MFEPRSLRFRVLGSGLEGFGVYGFEGLGDLLSPVQWLLPGYALFVAEVIMWRELHRNIQVGNGGKAFHSKSWWVRLTTPCDLFNRSLQRTVENP